LPVTVQKPQEPDAVDQDVVDDLEAEKSAPVRLKAGPSDAHQHGYGDLLGKFFDRQRAAVVARASKAAKADGDPDWWDSERWNRELAEDLQRLSESVSADAGRAALEEAGLDPSIYDVALTRGFLESTSKSRAEAINGATL